MGTAILKRKVERLKKIEMASDMDEILKEEIREYKETLTCPSCKVKRKDAILTKCFHVFCYHCLKTRYETRQRKCPKCNANFISLFRHLIPDSIPKMSNFKKRNFLEHVY